MKKKCFNREINEGRRVIKENDKMRERERVLWKWDVNIKWRLKRKEGGGFLTPNASWWFGFGARFGWRLCADKNDPYPHSFSLSLKRHHLPLPSPTRTHSLPHSPHSSPLLKLRTSSLFLSTLPSNHKSHSLQTNSSSDQHGNWKPWHCCQRNQAQEQENHGKQNLTRFF